MVHPGSPGPPRLLHDGRTEPSVVVSGMAGSDRRRLRWRTPLGVVLAVTLLMAPWSRGERVGSSSGAHDRVDALDGAPERAPVPAPPSSVPRAPVDEPDLTDRSSIIRVPGLSSTAAFPPGDGVDRWFEVLPAVQEIAIESTVDGTLQPALWLPALGAGPRPLLVVLHSWSSGYDQHVGIAYGQIAQANGWSMIHSHFRGRFEAPEATGSELAVADVIDAVDVAIASGGVDERYVFVVGYSGGGMMSLLLAGRHPDRFAGVAAWVPIFDLVAWNEHNRQIPGPYVDQVAASCGGDPALDLAARAECTDRSPSSYLAAARAAGVPVYLGAGLVDEIVPAEHAMWSFNALADPAERLAEDALIRLRFGHPPEGVAPGPDAPSYFAPDEPAVVLSRQSAQATLVIFDGAHDMVFHPALAWMSTLIEAE